MQIHTWPDSSASLNLQQGSTLSKLGSLFGRGLLLVLWVLLFVLWVILCCKQVAVKGRSQKQEIEM